MYTFYTATSLGSPTNRSFTPIEAAIPMITTSTQFDQAIEDHAGYLDYDASIALIKACPLFGDALCTIQKAEDKYWATVKFPDGVAYNIWEFTSRFIGLVPEQKPDGYTRLEIAMQKAREVALGDKLIINRPYVHAPIQTMADYNLNELSEEFITIWNNFHHHNRTGHVDLANVFPKMGAQTTGHSVLLRRDIKTNPDARIARRPTTLCSGFDVRQYVLSRAGDTTEARQPSLAVPVPVPATVVAICSAATGSSATHAHYNPPPAGSRANRASMHNPTPSKHSPAPSKLTAPFRWVGKRLSLLWR